MFIDAGVPIFIILTRKASFRETVSPFICANGWTRAVLNTAKMFVLQTQPLLPCVFACLGALSCGLCHSKNAPPKEILDA